MANNRDIDWPTRLAEAQTVVQTHLDRTPLVRVELGGFDARTYQAGVAAADRVVQGPRGAGRRGHGGARDGRPVVTASAGNHGLGVAFAATRLNARATVVVPENASKAKVEALRRFDIDLRLVGIATTRRSRPRSALGSRRTPSSSPLRTRTSSPDRPPWSAKSPSRSSNRSASWCRSVAADLAAGTALGAPARASVIGVEAQASRAVSASMSAGRVIDVDIEPTIADGLAGNIAADTITPRILRQHGVPSRRPTRPRSARPCENCAAIRHRRGGVRRRRHRRGRGRQHSRGSTDRVRDHGPQHRRRPSRRTTRGMITPGRRRGAPIGVEPEREL